MSTMTAIKALILDKKDIEKVSVKIEDILDIFNAISIKCEN